MATSREAVEFVIRGRDEGTANLLKQLTQSTKLFHKTMQVAGADDELLNSLSRLGAEAILLARDLGSVSVAGGLEADIERVVDVHNKLSDVTKENIEDIIKLKLQIGSYGKELSALKPKLRRVNEEIEGQKTALATATSAQTANNTELAKAVKNHADLIEKKRVLQVKQRELAKGEPASRANAENLRLVNEGIDSTNRYIARRKELLATMKGNKAAQDQENLNLVEARAALRALTQERIRLNAEAKKGGFRKDDKARAEIAETIRLLEELETQLEQGIQRRRELAATTDTAQSKEQNKLTALIALQTKYKNLISAIETNKGKAAKDLGRDEAITNKNLAKLRQYKADLKALERAEQELAAQGEITARATDKTARGHRRASGAVRQHARAQTALQAAMAKFYGNNRIQLSILQRMRTEVHGLLLQAAGVFAIYRGIQGVVESTKTVQKAENRLRSVVGDDAQLIGAELDFVRRNAKRLGIEFGILSNEYTKFSIATKNTNLEGANTRKIFASVAEAARVNGADNEALSGTFLALTQIVSKGTVTMEELKRQLGDRLPGAVHIMADALGVTTAELFKMVEAGEVTSDVLVQFADELDERFGPALGKALRTTQTQIGRLQHELFQTQLRIAESGFLESFNELLNTITKTLGSPEFQSFADRLGGALSGLASAAGWVIDRWAAMLSLFTALFAFKLVPFIVLLGTHIGKLGIAISLLNKQTLIASVSMGKFTKNLRRVWQAAVLTRTGINGARRGIQALMLLFRSMLPILTAAAVAFAFFYTKSKTEATDANTILQQHTKIIDGIADAWDAAGGKIEKYLEHIDTLSLEDLQKNQRDTRLLAGASRKEALDATSKQSNTFFAQEKYTGAGGGQGGSSEREILSINRERFERHLNTALNRQFRDSETSSVEIIEDWKANLYRLTSDLQEFYGLKHDPAAGTIAQNAELLAEKTFDLAIAAEKATVAVESKLGNVDPNIAVETITGIKRIPYNFDEEIGKIENDLVTLTGLNQDYKASLSYEGKLKAAEDAHKKLADSLALVRENLKSNLTISAQALEAERKLAKVAELEAKSLAEVWKIKVALAQMEDERVYGKNTIEATVADKEHQLEVAQLNFDGKGLEAALLADRYQFEKKFGQRKDYSSQYASALQRSQDATYKLYYLNKKGDSSKETDPGKLLQDAAKDLIQAKDSTEEEYNLTLPNIATGEFKTDPGLAKLRETFAQLAEKDVPAAIQAVLDYYEAIDEPTADDIKVIAVWKKVQLEQQNALDKTNEIKVSWNEGLGIVEGSINSGIDTFIEELIKTEKLFQSLELAAKSFFSSFLIDIGKAIQQQVALNAAKSIIKAVGGAFEIRHSGGLVGANGATTRNIPPIFEYHHDGGLAGLKSNEVAAILERNEEVLTRSDPRHILNGGKNKGGASAPPVTLNNYNYSSMSAAWQAFLNSPEGEGFKNFFNNNGMEV